VCEPAEVIGGFLGGYRNDREVETQVPRAFWSDLRSEGLTAAAAIPSEN